MRSRFYWPSEAQKMDAMTTTKKCVRFVLSKCEFVVAAGAAVIDVLFACVHFQWAFSISTSMRFVGERFSLEMRKAFVFGFAARYISYK